MKITIFRKIFILIALFLAFGLNNSFAENRSIDEIKSEIEVLKSEFENSKNDLEKRKINEKIEKLIDESIKLDKTIEKINPYIQTRAWGRVSEWYETLETGDIIVVKGPERDKTFIFEGGWTHALMIYDRNTIFEIEGPGYKSGKKGLWRE